MTKYRVEVYWRDGTEETYLAAAVRQARWGLYLEASDYEAYLSQSEFKKVEITEEER